MARLETKDRIYITHDDTNVGASIQLDEAGVGIYSAGCCDCGLVHDHVFIVRDNSLIVVPLSNDDETARLRKADKHAFIPRKRKARSKGGQ